MIFVREAGWRSSSAREACNVLPVLASMTIDARFSAATADGAATATNSVTSRRKMACHRRALQWSSVSRIAYSLQEEPPWLRHRNADPLASAGPGSEPPHSSSGCCIRVHRNSGFWRLCGAQPPADYQLQGEW